MPVRASKDGRLPWGALDWSHAPMTRFGVGAPCVHCGRPAFLRHPLTGKPCHKVCEDLVYDRPTARQVARAANGSAL